MNNGDSPLLSVRAEARQLVAPDYAVVDGLIEHTERSKVEAVRSVTGSLDRLTADLAALGAVPFDEGAGRRPLTWSAYSSATHEELYHDKETRRMERSGQVTATVALRVTVRDLDRLDDLSGVLAAQPGLNVHGVTWHVDWDNPAWPQVRAAAIGAAIGKARDYAAALGATVRHVEHIGIGGLCCRRRQRCPARDPGANSRAAGAHRDHRGSLPHHRRVPAKRLRPYPAARHELTKAAHLLHPGINGPGRPSRSQIPAATRDLNLDFARSLAT